MNFDNVARAYRWLEYAAFGRTLERQRFRYLPLLAGSRGVLILGEGDGRSLARLLELAPAASFDVLDSSREMIELARQRARHSPRARFFHQDALNCPPWPSPSYDAAVTHFFLDCFAEEDAAALIRRIANALEPGGTWIVSEFSIPERGWRRWHAAVWIRAMYWFFGAAAGLRAHSLPPFESLLRQAGMRRTALQEERFGLMRSEVWMKVSP